MATDCRSSPLIYMKGSSSASCRTSEPLINLLLLAHDVRHFVNDSTPDELLQALTTEVANHSELIVGMEGCCHQEVFVLKQMLESSPEGHSGVIVVFQLGANQLLAHSDARIIPQAHHLVLHELEVGQ